MDEELASSLAAFKIGTNQREPNTSSTPVASPELKEVIVSLSKEEGIFSRVRTIGQKR